MSLFPLIAAIGVGVTAGAAEKLPECTPRTVRNAVPRPAWWRVRPAELVADIGTVKKGTAEIIARTPGNFPVYAVCYGGKLPQHPINWPSASGSPRPELYSAPAQQTVMIAAGIHAEETEGIVLVSNLIALLETGRDHRGKERPHLVELCRSYRLVLLPCVNMDARSFAPDTLMGCTPDDYGPILTRLKNGKYLTWPTLKEVFPLPMDQVDQLGSYYNFNGINIQLDAAPGNIRSEEAGALLRLADRERIDFFLNLHSAREVPHVIPPSALNYPGNIRTVLDIRREWMQKESLPADPPGEEPVADTNLQTDLNNAVTLATGAPPMTFEFAALKKEPFDNKLECGYRIIEAILEHGLKQPLAPRRELLRTQMEEKKP